MYIQDVDNNDVTFSDLSIAAQWQESTMSDSANINLVNESSEDGAQSYKSDLVIK